MLVSRQRKEATLRVSPSSPTSFLALVCDLVYIHYIIMSSRPREQSFTSRRDDFLKSIANTHHRAPSPHRTPSHYHELRQLEPQEDLIQLASRPPTPRIQTKQSDPEIGEPHTSLTASSTGVIRKEITTYVW